MVIGLSTLKRPCGPNSLRSRAKTRKMRRRKKAASCHEYLMEIMFSIDKVLNETSCVTSDASRAKNYSLKQQVDNNLPEGEWKVVLRWKTKGGPTHSSS
ncbi:hypothetical protein NPIL_527541 [Nephila pilipes]|uniref:Uncharacterized protein n=1 Tax=Nephila pilipes TaxID=299642 RepID=A0A8X6NWJ4_NEPPI|nr:hypothetical protein NPIL_527541 [Nephila pilipes]